MSDTAITDLILHRLNDATLSERASELMLAAVLGDGEFDAALGGTPFAHDARPAATTTRSAPTDVYLTGISVTGFRGIGDTTQLPLRPGPGLTVVSGRNGSGKSSFAEAAELALTGDNKRWSGRQKVWQDGWRNLHTTGPTTIRVDFTAAGEGQGSVERTWRPGADYEQQESFSQFRSRPRRPLAELGWADALRLYRPFLSAAEFDALLRARPSEMYDEFQALLGLDALTELEHRLNAPRGDLRRRKAAPTDQRPGLLDRLRRSADPRAAAAADALGTTRPDLDALDRLAAEPAAGDADDGVLRGLAALRIPAPDDIDGYVDRLSAATRRQATLADTTATDARATVRLLDLALTHRESHPDQPCPVCRTGVLDTAWEADARDRRARLENTAAELEAAHHETERVLGELRGLVAIPASPAHVAVDTEPLRRARRRWQALMQGRPVDVVATGSSTYRDLADEVAAVRDRAAELLRSRDDEWRPLARDLASWVCVARDAESARRTLKALDEARNWLGGTAEQLRKQAFDPIMTAATGVWERLRQGSGLQVEALHLEGKSAAARNRHVDFLASIDGERCSALGTASQGELHALALALFLPRATRPESPFRFLIIDDPVQSMDPTKVYALARLLADEATHRQVVVFSHDDRLADAVRQLQLKNAVLLEVTRERSGPKIAPCDDPVQRYLDDAKNVAADTRLPDDARTITVAGLVRDALDAAAMRAVRARDYQRGVSAEEVERSLSGARRSRTLLALALQVPDRKVGEQLDRRYHGGGRILDAANEGAHKNPAGFRRHHPGNLRAFVDHAARLIEKLPGQPASGR